MVNGQSIHCNSLVGGGLLRSIGGWAELKEFRDLGIRIKGDERLLGSSDFVERVLKQAEEQLLYCGTQIGI